MRCDRFVELTRERLAASGHPDIASVDYYNVDGDVRGLAVSCHDGRTIFLHITRTSPPTGDDFSQAETIVTK
ncbi:MAG TPA: hypothetical protein VM677_07765 [Actinokineospora sp.]|jgi:hypothetical protein|nr:hypothetical protein [Actinokineospora sp.]